MGQKMKIVKREERLKGERIFDEVDEALNEHYQLNPVKHKIQNTYVAPPNIRRQALFDNMLKNMKFHTSLAEKKRIWMAGDEDSPKRFKKEDLVAWYRVWDQTQLRRANNVLNRNKSAHQQLLNDA